jgi:hypothetical protein
MCRNHHDRTTACYLTDGAVYRSFVSGIETRDATNRTEAIAGNSTRCPLWHTLILRKALGGDREAQEGCLPTM